jgi:hypothetical protein
MKIRSRVIAVPVTAILAALVLAACGGSSPTTTSTTSTSSTPSTSAGATPGAAFAATRAKLTACLKKYGVTLPAGGGFGGRRFGATGATGPFRRFGATGASGRRFFGATGGTGAPGTGFPPGGAGGFAGNPKFAAAFAKCGGAAGFGGFGRGRFGATGASGFGGVASPQYRAEVISYAACMKTHGVSLPKPNFSGTGFVFGTKVNRTTSKFIAANAKCAGLLTAPAPGGATG